MGDFGKALHLSPLARRVYDYMDKHHGITAKSAFMNLGRLTSGSLTRRIVDIERAGIAVNRRQFKDPIVGRQYTLYTLSR